MLNYHYRSLLIYTSSSLATLLLARNNSTSHGACYPTPDYQLEFSLSVQTCALCSITELLIVENEPEMKSDLVTSTASSHAVTGIVLILSYVLLFPSVLGLNEYQFAISHQSFMRVTGHAVGGRSSLAKTLRLTTVSSASIVTFPFW